MKTAVFYACKRLKITLKKRRPSIKKEMMRKESRGNC
ncbi:IS630 transposase-related protein [Candidatus Rhabdochlamydia porcellionis]